MKEGREQVERLSVVKGIKFKSYILKFYELNLRDLTSRMSGQRSCWRTPTTSRLRLSCTPREAAPWVARRASAHALDTTGERRLVQIEF